MNDIFIIATAILVAVNCGLLGVFLVLRRMSMIGDAISHAVLPGIAIAYLASGVRHSAWMMLGATIFGLITVFGIEWLSKKVRLQTDASIGITFTWLFAIGVVLISAFSGNIDLDLDCVLYGDLAYVPLDTLVMGGSDYGPIALWMQGITLVAVSVMLAVGYRGFYITSFDPLFASGLGILTAVWHYTLMGAVSLTVVSSFNAVGAVLVVAFLIVPAAAAYLISKSLKRMLVWTTLIGIASAVGGFYLADWWSASIAACMALAAGVIFTTIWLYTLAVRSLRTKRVSADQEDYRPTNLAPATKKFQKL